jgi:hypothetical protein
MPDESDPQLKNGPKTDLCHGAWKTTFALTQVIAVQRQAP